MTTQYSRLLRRSDDGRLLYSIPTLTHNHWAAKWLCDSTPHSRWYRSISSVPKCERVFDAVRRTHTHSSCKTWNANQLKMCERARAHAFTWWMRFDRSPVTKREKNCMFMFTDAHVWVSSRVQYAMSRRSDGNRVSRRHEIQRMKKRLYGYYTMGFQWEIDAQFGEYKRQFLTTNSIITICVLIHYNTNRFGSGSDGRVELFFFDFFFPLQPNKDTSLPRINFTKTEKKTNF